MIICCGCCRSEQKSQFENPDHSKTVITSQPNADLTPNIVYETPTIHITDEESQTFTTFTTRVTDISLHQEDVRSPNTREPNKALHSQNTRKSQEIVLNPKDSLKIRKGPQNESFQPLVNHDFLEYLQNELGMGEEAEFMFSCFEKCEKCLNTYSDTKISIAKEIYSQFLVSSAPCMVFLRDQRIVHDLENASLSGNLEGINKSIAGIITDLNHQIEEDYQNYLEFSSVKKIIPRRVCEETLI